MDIRRQRRGRSGFTLVELVLATTIAMLLLGALYVAVDMQLRFAQNSRDLVEESTLARALLARIDSDASQVVGLSNPGRFRIAAGADALADPSATGSSTSTTPTTTPSTTGTTSSTSSTSASSSTSSSTSSSSSTSTTDSGTSTNIVIPLGVQGDSETLHLFVSRFPRELYVNPNSDTQPVVSDLRRISYWLPDGQDSTTGLARQEVPLVTSDDALQNLPPGIDNESSYVIADEVRELNFQYFDGTNWQDSWDSTVPGADGVTPIGSPCAIAVTVGVARPGANGNLKTYRHVIAIQTANGNTPQSQTQSSQQSSTSTTGGGATP
jgi:type II secretory pathway pseudopilin PulG